MSKLHSICPEERFERKKNLKQKYKLIFFDLVNIFGPLGEKNSEFQGTFFAGLVKTAFCESIGAFSDLFKENEHVHSELADFGGKNQPTEGKIFLS